MKLQVPKRASVCTFEDVTFEDCTMNGVYIERAHIAWACGCGHASKKDHFAAAHGPDWSPLLRVPWYRRLWWGLTAGEKHV